MTKPSCFGTFIKTGKGSKDDSGSQGRTGKKRSNQLTREREKAWHVRPRKLSRIPLKVVDSCTTRSYVHTWIHSWHVLCTNIIIMTHAINSNTILLSIHYITRMHTQMRKSPRGQRVQKKWRETGKKEKNIFERKKIKTKVEKNKKLFKNKLSVKKWINKIKKYIHKIKKRKKLPRGHHWKGKLIISWC